VFTLVIATRRSYVRRRFLIIALLLPTVLLSACGETMATRLAMAQQQWLGTGITSYRITVEYI